MSQRVAITGLGLVTPLGTGVTKTWEALLQGRSGVDTIANFDASECITQFAAEVKDFDPAQDLSDIPTKELKRMDMFIQYAMAASMQAMQDAGIDMQAENPERVGVCIGSGMGGLPGLQHNFATVRDKGVRRLSPFAIPRVLINLAPGYVSMFFGAKGPNTSPVTACATGNHSIGDAYLMMQQGYADVMIAGSTEAAITSMSVGGFNSMHALSTLNENPQGASRPFDKDRSGFVMGEGAGILVLETWEHAQKRGAKIYAELAGYGLSADAYHITQPAPEGEGAQRCMRMTLKDAGLNPDQVDYINAHGTSTPLNDLHETQAIKHVFGAHAAKLPISSTKSMTGHLLGGAGGIEAVFSALALHHGVIPPTINYQTPDPECDLDYTPNQARELPVKTAISNSFGFGGTNACLAFRKV